MGASFGGTVKLQGESEYKKALSEITGNLRVLGSEMKVVTSQFGTTDKSVSNLSAQNEVLNKKIEEQSKKVEVLKGALEQAKNETGDNSSTTKKWQVELNNAQAELNSLNKKVSDNNLSMEQAKNVTEDETKSLKDFGNEANSSSEKSLKLGDIIKANLISDVIKSGLRAVAEGVKNISNSMAGAITDGAAYADNILTLSTQTGVSAENLQKYNAVAELVDVSTETMTNSMAKNIKQMANGSDAYNKLGISVKDANGNLRDSDEVYWECIDALGKVENETQRDAIAMEIFGKKAQDLNPLIQQGSEGIKNLGDEAVRMGAVLSDEALQSLGAVDDEIQIFKTTTSATGNILASAFAPSIASVLSGVNDLGAGFNYLISSIISGDSGGISEASQMLNESVTNMINNIVDQAPQILNIINNLITTIGGVIVNNLPVIIEGGMQILTSLINGITNALPQILPVVVQAILTIAQGLIENLPTILQAGITIIIELVKGISSSLPTLIPAVVDAILVMTETLIDNIDLIIDAGIQLIMGLVEGLINALPILIEKIPVIIDKLINAITNNLPKLIEAGIILTIKLAEGLIKAIPQLVAQLPHIISSIVNGLASGVSKIWEVGENLVRGLWEGIKNVKDWIMDKIRGFGQSILDGIKGFFGIHSPSSLFRDEVGKFMAQGIGVGFSDEMSNVTKDMQNSIPTEFDISSELKGNFSKSSNVSELKNMIIDILKEFNPTVILDSESIGEFAFNYGNKKYGNLY